MLPSFGVLSVVDEREVEVFGRLAGHAKIRAGWLAATADQQFSWSPNAGPYESCGHAESGSQTIDDDYEKWACTSAATATTAESHSPRVHADRMACRLGCSPRVCARGWTGGRCCSLAGTGRRRRGSRRRVHACAEFVPFLRFDNEIRTIICTMNADRVDQREAAAGAEGPRPLPADRTSLVERRAFPSKLI